VVVGWEWVRCRCRCRCRSLQFPTSLHEDDRWWLRKEIVHILHTIHLAAGTKTFMATFSPSPAPRRTTHRHITPRPAGTSPPITARRTRLGSSKPSSRRGTPARNTTAQERLPYINDGSSVMSGMDVDDDGASSSVMHAPPKLETLFAKSDELSVAFYANLPVEVKQVLKNAG